MKKIKRRFLRTLGVLFGLLLIWNIFYFFSLSKTPDRQYEPLTTGTADSEYSFQIEQATDYLKTVTERINTPSFSIAVGHNDRIVWSAAAGFADVEEEKPATPQTQYRIGSTSKAVTATGIAHLVDAGALNLDAYVGDTIVNWPKKDWNFTTRQLLSHTAGVGNYEDFGIASARYTLCNCVQFNSVTEGLSVFNRYDLLYEPGTNFKYSTFDVNLASAVLEQASGQEFLPYLKERIFDPLQMTSTYGDHAQPKTEHFATFYETDGGYYREFRNFGMAYDVNLSYKWAGGGIISTPSDLVKMGNAYLNDTTFLSSNIKQQLWTPMKLRDGSINVQEYAMGWRSYLAFEEEYMLDGKPVWMVHHGGVSKGSMNFLVIFPNYNLVIDASINTIADKFSDFSREVRIIADFFLQEIEKQELPWYQDIKEEVAL